MTDGPSSPTSTRARGFLSAGLDTSNGAPFVQARLALLGKTIFWLSFIFYLALNVMIVGWAKLPFLDHILKRDNLAHLATSLVALALWGVAARGRWSLKVLGILDAASLVLMCVGWRVMAVYGNNDAALAALMATLVTTVARAILVPSSGKRTFWLTAFAALPLTGVIIVFHSAPAPPPEMGLPAGFEKAMMGLNAF